MTHDYFNEDVKDFLEEVLNVSFGAATSVISDMMGTFATLHIPNSELIDTTEFSSIINQSFDPEKKYFISSQQFRGDIEGETIFVLDEKSTHNLAVHLDGYDETQQLDEEDIMDSSVEVTNLVTSSCIRNIGEYLECHVFFSQPSIKVAMRNEIVRNTNIEQYKTIIVIRTMLDLQEEKIQGNFYILLKDHTLKMIKDKAEEFFED